MPRSLTLATHRRTEARVAPKHANGANFANFGPPTNANNGNFDNVA